MSLYSRKMQSLKITSVQPHLSKSLTDPEKIQFISKLEETVFRNTFHRKKKSQTQDSIIKIIINPIPPGRGGGLLMPTPTLIGS